MIPLNAMRAILHIDMDAFFAAVEVLDFPELRGLPVVVGGTPEGRGVVAAASYEARNYGIHSAMSAWQARQRCPQAVFRAPRGARYRDVSRAIFAIFNRFTPLVEALSIDEAFLDVTGCERLFGTAEQIGRRIKQLIRDEIGLTASVGVAPNKFLAKLASDYQKPDGFFVMDQAHAAGWLAELPVSRLWGVGKVTQRTLAALGIVKVDDLLAYPADVLERRLGSWTPTLLELARGIDERPVTPESEAKSIGAETTFARDIASAEALRRELDGLVDRSAYRLRKHGLRARTVHLKARYPDFTTLTRADTLSQPTDHTGTLRRAARNLLEHKLGRANRPLRLLGVSFSNFESPDMQQLELFDEPHIQKDRQLDRLLDGLRAPDGRPLVQRGLPANED
jgi:DNA polymerase-4